MSKELFAVVPERVLADNRIQRAALALAASGLTGADFAEPAIVGILTSLALRQLRAGGEDGIIGGDPIAFVRHALGIGPKEASAVLTVLVEAGLLEVVPAGHLIVGYDDIYAPILLVRSKDAARKRADREEAKRKAEANKAVLRPVDVQRTSGGLSDASAPSSVSRKPSPESSTSESKAPSPPAAAGPVPPKKRADRRHPVERLLEARGAPFQGFTGVGLAYCRREWRKLNAAGATDAEIADIVQPSTPADTFWDVHRPLSAKYGKTTKQGGTLAPVGSKYADALARKSATGGTAS